MPEWLQRELSRQLRPVEAPEELWRRVRSGRSVPERRRPKRSPVLLLAAAAMVLTTVGAIWLFGGSPAGVRTASRVGAEASCYACHTSL